MRLADALALGRISNLPTVWSNVLAGVVLAGGTAGDPRVPLLLLALSLCYVAGMFLNDAFDAPFDTVHRQDRPIPSGRVGLRSAFLAGFGMLAAGVAALAWTGYAVPDGTGLRPLLAGLALAAAIVFYDWHHKGNAFSPVVMGLCRMLSYLAAGWAISSVLPAGLWVAAILSLCYLIGLTYTAKQEHLDTLKNLWPLAFMAAPVAYALGSARSSPGAAVVAVLFVGWLLHALRSLRRRGPGDVPRAVSAMLAGICLWDAVLLAAAGQVGLAALAVAAFGLALVLQRYVAAT